MTILGHKPFYRGSSCVCADCGLFLFDVRTGARLRELTDVDPKKLAAVERRFSFDPKLAKRLVDEDPYEVVATYKFADKYNDFLMNPKARPDLQTPEAQQFLQALQPYHNSKTDAIMPWLTREWKKGRIRQNPTIGPGSLYDQHTLQFDGGPEYEHEYGSFHNLMPEQLNHWADWYGSDHESRKGRDIMQMKTPELHQTIKGWDQDMRDKAGGAAQKRGDIVHSYPDGWTVQQLQEAQLEEEGEKMGHCVGSYGPSVQRGESLIYSLRDHQNEPHATWEITPKWHEGEDGKLYSNPDGTDETDQHYFRTTPSPKGGTMEQIQGKGNKPPIEDYQKRIKDYFEKTMPNPEDRPKWDEQDYDEYDGLDKLMDEEGHEGYIAYHPGEYGLETPKTNYDWPELAQKAIGWEEYEPHKVVAEATKRGQFEPFASEAQKIIQREREGRQNEIANEWDHREPEFANGYYEEDPEPDYESYGENQDQYNKDWAEWEKREQEAREEMQRRFYTDYENNNSWDRGNYMDELESEIAAQKLREKRALEEGQQPTAKVASASPHQHYSTGEHCYCTFRKAPESRWAAFDPMVCEVCGDPLEHGKCKRCDWGQWSNAMGPGDQNPQDPAKELHPAIQA